MPPTLQRGIVLPLNRIEPPLRLEGVFGRASPLEVEIGFGKGSFLLDQARRCPERDFLGIEASSRYFRWTLRRVEREGLRNVRLVREEAAYFVERYLEANSVARFHVYYPDPWPKRRHRKRRLIRPSFVALVAERLAPGGELCIVTDHEEYFAEIVELLGAEARLVAQPDEDAAWEGWGTNFARKYEREERRVLRARFRREIGAAAASGCVRGEAPRPGGGHERDR